MESENVIKIEPSIPPMPLNTSNINTTAQQGSDIESDNDSSIISASTGRSENSKAEGKIHSSKNRGRKSKTKSTVPKSPYRLNCFVSEEGNKQIFAVQFNHFIKNRSIFATASGFRVSIYECINVDDEDEENDDFSGIKLLRAYDDPDRGEKVFIFATNID